MKISSFAALQLPEDMATKSPQKAPATAAFSLIGNDKLQQMYVAMLKCRILDSHLRQFSQSSSLKGKEAAFVASTIDLRPEDAVVDASGGALASFLKGMPLHSLPGRAHTRKGKQSTAKRQAAVSAGEAAECAIATGVAYARRPGNPENLTVAFLSSNPASSEAARRALLFAGAQKLPIIYVYTGREALDVSTIASLGFPVIPVDGKDVVAVYRVMFEGAVRARRGNGPSIIACDFSASGSRRDPIRNMQTYLSAKGLFHAEKKLPELNAFEKEIKHAANALNSATISPESRNIFFV